MIRKCTKCKIEKTLLDFYIRKKGLEAGRPYFVCKICMKERGRRYYMLNIIRQRKLALIRKRKYIEERVKFVNSLKNKPCMDCNKIFPSWVMDFDHKGGNQKLGSISDIVRHKTWKFDKIRIEIEKCDIVCANCHRSRTYFRLHPNAEVAKLVKASA